MDADAVLPKRRLNFSVAMKQQAIAWINGPGLGSRARAVAHFRGLNWEVTAETLDKWWRQREKIMAGASVGPEAADARLDKPRWALLSAPQETALAAVIRRRARKVRVSAKWIALAVRQMYPETTPPSFSVSPTWLLGFAQRHGLALVGTTVVASHSTDQQYQPQSHSRRRAASAPAAASSAAKSQSARTMSLHDVLYEEKPVAATIAA